MSTTRPRPPASRVAAPAPQEPRRRPRTWVVGLALVAVLCAGLVVVMRWTTVMDARRVEVTGVNAVLTAQVKAAADVPLGGPLARVDLESIGNRITESVPGVARVQVQRHWPHTVVLVVHPRIPVAVLGTGASAKLVDEFGAVFAPTGTRPAALPTITLVGKGNRADLKTATLVAATSVARSLPASVAVQVTGIQGRSPEDVRLALKRGAVVRWGSASDPIQKGRVIVALLTRQAAVYDVSAPDLPTTSGKLKKKKSA